MTITILLFGGGILYWFGLVAKQRLSMMIGASVLLALLINLLAQSAIDLIAFVLLLLMGLLAFALKRTRQKFWSILGWVCFIAIVLALGFKILPFFSSFETLQTAQRVFYFPTEKVMLLMLLPPMVLIPWHLNKNINKSSGNILPSWFMFFLLLIGILVIVIPVAWSTGFAIPGLSKQAPGYLLYALSYNLIYTCVLEESLFRGILQNALISSFSRTLSVNKAQIIGVLWAALLFALAHWGGGWVFVLLAFIAGIGYGLIYELTGRLYFAVLLHFAVNVIHQVFLAGSS